MKKCFYFLLAGLAMAACCLLFPGCSRESEKSPDTLWIVTEKTTKDGMNGQAEHIIKAFEKAHEGVTVELEILPEEGQEREIRLEKLRAAIMAGKGPDGFLLPLCTYQNEPLFMDVNQAMYAGLFADISEYYDADDTEGLLDVVMDAGVVDGGRYVLPLRYDMPVIYTDRALLENSDLDESQMAEGVLEFWEEVRSSEDANWLRGSFLQKGYQMGESFCLPAQVDYESGVVAISREELIRYFTACQQIREAQGDLFFDTVGYVLGYLNGGTFFHEGHPMEVSRLGEVIEYASIAEAEGRELVMIPLGTTDGKTVAMVTYYAAVGAGCTDPELTYEFLREFLTEQSQWEQNRMISGMYATGLIEEGWPVRSIGAAEPLWDVCMKIYQRSGDEAYREKLFAVTLTDEDLPILNTQIDEVRFATVYLDEQIIGTRRQALYDSEFTDIGKLADQIIKDLEHHLAEG